MFKKIQLYLTKQKLDNIGPGMCLEKWTSCRVYLHTGHTHSCHHPQPHVIPVEELKNNPGALHNTNYKKQQRKTMLDQRRPDECQYCWNIEDYTDSVYSDRHLVSSKPRSMRHYKDITTGPWDQNFNPSFLEVSFSGACNFACAYCGPGLSSKWLSEIDKHGPYPTSTEYNKIYYRPFLEKDSNPYVDAFWNWLPIIYKGLDTLRITGGEPLMTKHTFRMLSWVIDNPNPNLTISINTNLCVEKELFEKFIDFLYRIKPGVHVKNIEVHTSNEASGHRAEYIRYGMDYDLWLENINQISTRLPHVKLGFMVSYNLLSVSSFSTLLQDLKGKGSMSITYVRDPDFLDIRLLPKDWRHYLEDSLKYLKKHYNKETQERFKQVLSYFDTEMDNVGSKQKDFVAFINEYDKRRSLNFAQSFYEYQPWFQTIS